MKLHELLAVEQQAKSQATSTRTDLMATFSNKRHLFEEKRSTFLGNEEGAKMKVESQSDIQSSVMKELAWIKGIWSKALNISYNVAHGNTEARADVVLESGVTLLRNVPATALLELEKRAGEVLDLLKTVPTLDPAKGFRADKDRGDGIYAAREVTKTRTKKVIVPIVKAVATEHHPAQVELVNQDVPVGEITEQEWSALLSPADKSVLLERAEELRRAVRQARTRANDTIVDVPQDFSPGDVLLGYVFGV